MRERSTKVWELRVQLPRTPTDVAAKRYPQKSVTFHGGKRAAQTVLGDLERRAAAGEFTPGPGAGTVAELLERYFASRTTAGIRQPWELNTAMTNRTMIDLHLTPTLGTAIVDELEATHIEDAYLTLAAAGVGRPTIIRAHAVLRSAYNFAMRTHRLRHNPAAFVDIDPAPKPKAPKFTTADAAKIIALAYDRGQDSLATIIRMAATTGARRGELAALRWEDLEFFQEDTTGTDGAVSKVWFAAAAIDHNLVVKKGVIVRKTTKSDDGTRSAVMLGAGTTDVLRSWHKASAETALAMGWSLGPDTPVWRRPTTNEPIRPDTVTRAFKRLAERAGYPDVTFHDCRHSMATQLVADGFDIGTVGDRMGHRQRSTTPNVYSHGVAENDRRAARHLDQVLDAG